MILWKVVTLDRYSAITYNTPLTLHYSRGKIVTGIQGTLGVMCFEKREQAEDFVSFMSEKHQVMIYYYILLQVKPLGTGIRPRFVYKSIYDAIRYLKDGTYRDRLENPKAYWDPLSKIHFIRKAPAGTICYPAVKVLT